MDERQTRLEDLDRQQEDKDKGLLQLNKQVDLLEKKVQHDQ